MPHLVAHFQQGIFMRKFWQRRPQRKLLRTPNGRARRFWIEELEYRRLLVTVNVRNSAEASHTPNPITFAAAVNMINHDGGGTINLAVPIVDVENASSINVAGAVILSGGNATLNGDVSITGSSVEVMSLSSSGFSVNSASANVHDITFTGAGNSFVSISGNDAVVSKFSATTGSVFVTITGDRAKISQAEVASGSISIVGSNGSISDCNGVGLGVSASTGSTNTIENCHVAGIGLTNGASNSFVRNNVVVGSGGVSVNGNMNEIENITIDNVSAVGLIIGGNKNKITSVKVRGSSFSIGGDENEVKFSTVGLTAAGAAATTGGLSINGNKNLVMLNTIVGGVTISGSENTLDTNNIGTDTTGTQRRFIGPLGGVGITLQSSAAGTTKNTIKNNVIAGNNVPNAAVIISISGATTAFNKLEANKIGVDATGNVALGGTWYGIEIDNAPDNTIGGDTPAKGNIIGSNKVGIFIRGAFSGENKAVRNLIKNNYIGVGANGTTDLGNTGQGIFIEQKVKRGASQAAGESALVIENNVISGNGSDGIQSRGADIEIYGNKIGTNATGTAKLENGGTGILLNRQLVGESDNIKIGKVGAGNVISGNGGSGIGYVRAPGLVRDLSNIVIKGNKIGSNAAGTAKIGNHRDGVSLNGTEIQIGGGVSGEGNVISGNDGDGIALSSDPSQASNIKIQGNRIGTNDDGDAALANGGNGISLFDCKTALIGGNTGVAGNLIGGNTGTGVYMSGGTTNFVLGNGIGVNVDGAAALGNKNGVEIFESPGNFIGSADQAVGNVISGNLQAGVLIRGATSTNNVLSLNTIGLSKSTAQIVANGTSGIIVREGASRTIIGANDGSDADNSPSQNVIAGNAEYGVLLTGAGSGNTIRKNLIGVSVENESVFDTGWNNIVYENQAQMHANGLGGVRIDGALVYALVEENVIGGHRRENGALPGFGIGIFGNGAATTDGSLRIDKNYVGIDRQESTDLGNRVGILLENVNDAVVADNVIGNNRQVNAWLRSGTRHVALIDNLVGVKSTGSSLFNTGSGIIIDDSSDNSVSSQEDGAVVRYHDDYGIRITGSSTRNEILKVSIGNNQDGGIEVEGTTSRRPDRAFVVLEHVFFVAGQPRFLGQLIGAPNTTYEVEYFATDATKALRNGEGLRFVENFSYTTNADGTADINTSIIDPTLSSTDYFTATATHPDKTTFGYSKSIAAASTGGELLLEILDAGNTSLQRTLQATLRKFGVNLRAGDSSNLSALSDPNAIAGATVSFFSNGVKLGEAVTDENGVANFTTPNLTSGANNFVAAFEGDDTHAGAVSDVTSTTVEGGPLGVSAGQGGANPNDEGRGVVVDSQGNSYVVGTKFYADAASDSTATKTSDIYLAKYDKNGVLVWRKTISGTGDDRGLGIARDSSDNIYITGGFQGTVNFNPGSTAKNLKSTGGFDVFVASYNKNGTYRWAHNYGNKSTAASSADIGYGIAVDSSNKVIVTGQFAGTADFDASSKTLNLKSKGGTDAFVLSLTSGGTTSFAKQLGGTSTDRGTAVVVDSSKQIYVAGSFSGTADFNPSSSTSNLKSAGGKDAFLARLSSSGAFSYARAFGGKSNDEAHGVVVDSSRNAYITGYFADTADLNPSSTKANFTSKGSNDAFVVRLNSNGNYTWAKTVGGTGDDRGRGIVRQSNGDLAVIGDFNGTVDFDPSSATGNVTSHGGVDAFVLRLNSSGGYKSVVDIGGTGADRGRAVAVDSADKLYALGQFFESLSLNTGEGEVDLTSAGGEDLFLVRLT
jgi:hypothetical protein